MMDTHGYRRQHVGGQSYDKPSESLTSVKLEVAQGTGGIHPNPWESNGNPMDLTGKIQRIRDHLLDSSWITLKLETLLFHLGNAGQTLQNDPAIKAT